MDLLDFQGESLYFDEACADEVEQLLQSAALNYGRQSAETSLLRAYFIAPENLTVLVAMYRYYYYGQQYQDSLLIAERAMRVVAERLEINPDWRELNRNDLARGVSRSMGLMRFHLYALKAAGLIKLRIGDTAGALQCLNKVTELDAADRIGADQLLVIAKQAASESGVRSATYN